MKLDVHKSDNGSDSGMPALRRVQTTLEHIRGIRGRLSLKCRVIADKILSEPDLARDKNISELAEICAVSEATVSRFVRSIGSDNYRAFQLRIAKESSQNRDEFGISDDMKCLHEALSRHDSAKTIIAKISHRSADVARTCSTTLDMAAMERAAEMIHRAQVIYFFAAGLSILAAENALLRFSRIGKPAVFHREHNTQLLMSSSLHEGALAVGISDSGRTNHTVSTLALARQAGAATLAVTSFPDSPLARHGDVSLITPAGFASAAEPLIYERMISKFGQLVAIDALYALVAVQDFDSSAKLIDRGDNIIRQSRQEP